jgi:hypothetical protein
MGWEDSDSELETKVAHKVDQAEEEQKFLNKAPAISVSSKKKSTGPSGVTVKEYDEDEIQLTDAAAEKARLQRLEIRGDMAAADDLFAGFGRAGLDDSGAGSRVREITKVVEKDTFAELQLKTSKEVEAFAQKCAQKLKQSKVKSCVYAFLKDVLRHSEATIEAAECTQLARTLNDLEKAKKRAVAEKMQNKKKGIAGDAESMKLGAKVDVAAELDEVYGYSDEEDF